MVGTIVNPRHAPVVAVGALDIEIIAKSGAALIDRGLQDVDDGLTQQFDLRCIQVSGGCIGSDPRTITSLSHHE